ncbi:MAG: hypothetical protein R3B84_08155 [Zavarzinella sp.]
MNNDEIIGKAMARVPEGTVSKTQMVRQALDELGKGAKPKSIQEFVKERHQTDITTMHISQIKSHLKKHGKLKPPRAGKTTASAAPAAVVDEETGSAKTADIVKFIRTLEEWQEKLGTSELNTVIKSYFGK